MARYTYDDFRITLTPRGAQVYTADAVDATGHTTTGRFDVPEHLVAVSTPALAARSVDATALLDPDGSARDVGGRPVDALEPAAVGAALFHALFDGAVGSLFLAARERAEDAGRGTRLSLMLRDTPELLVLPWELLHERPRFLASQRRTPVVRVLDVGTRTAPPPASPVVRILGVIANPAALTQLNVHAERERIETALSSVVSSGDVKLDWLQPASPRRLREALRDREYHVVHYVGHGDFTTSGDSVLYLEDEDGRPAALGRSVLANVLSDQTSLRLVVLNSCHGARTTLADPYAGIATTLIELGVPAVVAMQSPISDRAAIVFAEELYTGLIANRDPLDAAMSEARKAMFVELGGTEWATPVQFVRNPELALFAPSTAHRRGRRWWMPVIATAAAVVIGALLVLQPWHDDSAGVTGLTVAITPDRGTAGSTFTVTPNEPCPPAPAGSTDLDVVVFAEDPRPGVDVMEGDRPQADSGRWQPIDITVDERAASGTLDVRVHCRTIDADGNRNPYADYALAHFEVLDP